MSSQREAVAAAATPEAWPTDAVEAMTTLIRRVTELRRENDQLRTALTSRIAIEQAKGVLAERHLLLPDQAFEALRAAARSTGRRLHDVAQEVVTEPYTPDAVARELEKRADRR